MKGPLKTCEMALRLKAHTADAAMLFLNVSEEEGEEGEERALMKDEHRGTSRKLWSAWVADHKS